MKELVRARPCARARWASPPPSSTSTSARMDARCRPTTHRPKRWWRCAACWPSSTTARWRSSRAASRRATTRRTASCWRTSTTLRASRWSSTRWCPSTTNPMGWKDDAGLRQRDGGEGRVRLHPDVLGQQARGAPAALRHLHLRREPAVARDAMHYPEPERMQRCWRDPEHPRAPSRPGQRRSRPAVPSTMDFERLVDRRGHDTESQQVAGGAQRVGEIAEGARHRARSSASSTSRSPRVSR